ncbi:MULTISPECIES: arginase family protein [Paenibacillus]|jgi:arginase|uniref:Arginase family protein n=1 Tax=Paenibacillus polymyxa TaxID=1406 RepID=A0AAP3ZY32_PAEPO|nr:MULTISPECIES: arginase family protein [Paenibacillus]APQ59534.1 arginase [Paenibacillus polymyxa]MCP3747754.1 arginase family protein [Paenibacillus sp. A3M_27_13]MDH2331523.1 arginase family protein [Paenibacillus polymyxa]VUG07470.1 Arginase [Paenibacillus polymyxa]
MNEMDTSRTLRLLFPQWQGGNNPPYVLGAHLLNWLAPKSNGPFEEVPVDLNPNVEKEQGIISKSTVLQQARSAKSLIHKHNPERIVVLGGDCSVELAPFSYLNEKYDGDVALLWVDAHPDVSIPEDFENHHAHVLANLLGVGDQEFVAEVPHLFKPEQILYVGLNDMIDALHSEPMKNMKLDIVGPDEIKQDSSKVLQWLAEKKPSKIIIHFDLDVLDMKEFRSLLVAYPGTYEEYTKSFPQGSSMETIIRVLQDVAKSYDVVGLGITEHFPWDSYFLANMLSRLPLLGDIDNKERPVFNTL